MRLTDLDPKWFDFDGARAGFTFLCPHCRAFRLSCKSRRMTHAEQMKTFKALGFKVCGWTSPQHVNLSNPDVAWAIANDFATMTVSPSIDASHSGHWHGFITAGVIVGGVQKL